MDISSQTLARVVEALPTTAARLQPSDQLSTIRTAIIIAGHVPLHKEPDETVGYLSQLLYGEAVRVFEDASEDANGWVRCQAKVDGYIGYLRADSIIDAETITKPTHRIAVPFSHFYGTPDIKCPPQLAVPMCARLCLTGRTEGNFSEISVAHKIAWVTTSHIRAISDPVPDYVDIALAFLGSPYLWGGRTAMGIDCSGLVQISLAMAGHATPRDSDMQEAVVGEPTDPASLCRGDLVFFPGHVGIMTSKDDIVHANATFMAVTHEPLPALVGRLKAEHAEPITSARRLSAASPTPAK